MAQTAFFVDTSICTGCRTCQVACQEHNDLTAAVLWRRVFQYGGGSWVKSDSIYVPEGVFRYYVSVSCNHCVAPACIAVCPVSAIVKDEDTGIVWIDRELCIGCRSCEGACPYQVPVFDEASGIETKCDFCRVDVAKGQTPACVDSCPTRALDFGDSAELALKYAGSVDALEPLPVPSTGPSLLLKAHKDAQESGKGTGRILNMPEEL